MRKTLLVSLFLVAALPAFAAEHEAAEKPSKPGAPPVNSVEMPALIAPVVVDGRLQGYLYISSRVTANSASTAIAIREKLAFIQDAFVRDVNMKPILVSDPAHVDRAQLGQRLVANARKIMGDSNVTGIIFGDGAKDIGIKFSSLRPDLAPSLIPIEALEDDAAPAPKPKKEH